MSKCKLSREEMQELRNNGYTYIQIAEIGGVSKQRVFQLIGKTSARFVKPITEANCIYPNLRNWMNNNHISRMELVRQMYGEVLPQAYGRVRAFLNGDVHMHINKYMLDRILKVTGLTYEQLFADN